MSELTYQFEDLPPAGTVREVAPGIKWLQMPLPFVLDHINLYLLEDGDSWTLVDTGLGGPDTQKYWEQIFEGALDGKPISRVIVTHMHPDHSGQAGWICRRFGAQLHMTRGEYYYARAVSGDKPEEFPESAVEFYRRGGLNGSIIDDIRKRGWGHFAMNVEPLPPEYYRLEDGQILRIGEHTWQVVVGSGHSPEHACLFCPALDVLISGDQVLPRITSNVSVHPNEPEDNPLKVWLESHEDFMKLPDSALVLPSHDRPFHGLHARLRYLIHHHEDRMLAVEEVCDEPKTAGELLPVMFKRELDSFQTMMALGECISHLHLLMHRGRLARELSDDGLYLYRSVDPTLDVRAHPEHHDDRDDTPMMV